VEEVQQREEVGEVEEVSSQEDVKTLNFWKTKFLKQIVQKKHQQQFLAF